MHKRSINYEDFNGDDVTEEFYFNLSKPELIELEVDYAEGLVNTIERISKTEDRKELVALFKRLILQSYGQKSPDGKRFIKSDQLREEFSQTAAYAHLFMELSSSSEKAVQFINGIMPKDMQQDEKKVLAAAAVDTASTP